MFSASQKLSYMAPTKTGSKNLLCRLLYLLHKHIPHPSAFTYYMRGIDDLRLRLRTDFPPSLVMHGEKRPDRHLDLAFSGHISHMSVPVHTSMHFPRPEILFSELFLYVRVDIRHYIIVILLNTAPKTDCIRILKKHAFIVRIK